MNLYDYFLFVKESRSEIVYASKFLCNWILKINNGDIFKSSASDVRKFIIDNSHKNGRKVFSGLFDQFIQEATEEFDISKTHNILSVNCPENTYENLDNFIKYLTFSHDKYFCISAIRDVVMRSINDISSNTMIPLENKMSEYNEKKELENAFASFANMIRKVSPRSVCKLYVSLYLSCLYLWNRTSFNGCICCEDKKDIKELETVASLNIEVRTPWETKTGSQEKVLKVQRFDDNYSVVDVSIGRVWNVGGYETFRATISVKDFCLPNKKTETIEENRDGIIKELLITHDRCLTELFPNLSNGNDETEMKLLAREIESENVSDDYWDSSIESEFNEN